MKSFIRTIKKHARHLVWKLQILCGSIIEYFSTKTEAYAFFDPSLDSYNLGDSIISYYCRSILADYLDCNALMSVQTHQVCEKQQQKRLSHTKNKIVFGTNIISPQIEQYSIWSLPKSLLGYRGAIAMGVGLGHHSESASSMSAFVYRHIFSSAGIHSVRDSNTEALFHQAGIHNVVNTGCPTLWKLTPEHCLSIPSTKAESVVATITDYDRNPEMDAAMLSILQEEYSHVYVWIQGADDLKYLETLIDLSSVEIIEYSVNAYTSILTSKRVDYVGTRLHGGIHALNCGVRSLVISIDNRAEEMSRDFALPVIPRESVPNTLRNWINGDQKTELQLPWDNIAYWKSQFEENRKPFYSDPYV